MGAHTAGPLHLWSPSLRLRFDALQTHFSANHTAGGRQLSHLQPDLHWWCPPPKDTQASTQSPRDVTLHGSAVQAKCPHTHIRRIPPNTAGPPVLIRRLIWLEGLANVSFDTSFFHVMKLGSFRVVNMGLYRSFK